MSRFTSTPLAAGSGLDVEVSDPPSDSISAMAFSPVADYLAVASWDNNVRIYQVSSTGQSQGKAIYSHDGPVLDVCWSKDGQRVFSGGADNAAKMFDLSTGESVQVAAHDAPVKCVRWIENGRILATGSWDKTIKYWDTRNATPLGTITLPERCYSMDVCDTFLVVATAEHKLITISLSNPMAIYNSVDSPLKRQTRVVTCFPSGDGYAVAGVEGRLAVQWVGEKGATNNYSFKCHRKDRANAREGTDVYAVNAVAFHQQYGTFCTAGSDGVVCFWDKDARCRLKSFDPAPGPISCASFNHTGTVFAYAVSYDWSKGHSGAVAGQANKIMLHQLKVEEIKNKPRK